MESFSKLLNESKAAAGREEKSRFGTAGEGRERFAFEMKKARAYMESAVNTLATLASFHNGDADIAANVAATIGDAIIALEMATLPENYAAPAIRKDARVRINPDSMAARYLVNVDGMRTILSLDGGMATLTGNVRVPVSDLIPVK